MPKIVAGSGKTKRLTNKDRIDLLGEISCKTGISVEAVFVLLEGVGDRALVTVAGNALESGVARTRVRHATEADAEGLLNTAKCIARALLVIDERLSPADPMTDILMSFHSQIHEQLTRANQALFSNDYVEREGGSK